MDGSHGYRDDYSKEYPGITEDDISIDDLFDSISGAGEKKDAQTAPYGGRPDASARQQSPSYSGRHAAPEPSGSRQESATRERPYDTPPRYGAPGSRPEAAYGRYPVSDRQAPRYPAADTGRVPDYSPQRAYVISDARKAGVIAGIILTAYIIWALAYFIFYSVPANNHDPRLYLTLENIVSIAACIPLAAVAAGILKDDLRLCRISSAVLLTVWAAYDLYVSASFVILNHRPFFELFAGSQLRYWTQLAEFLLFMLAFRKPGKKGKILCFAAAPLAVLKVYLTFWTLNLVPSSGPVLRSVPIRLPVLLRVAGFVLSGIYLGRKRRPENPGPAFRTPEMYRR